MRTPIRIRREHFFILALGGLLTTGCADRRGGNGGIKISSAYAPSQPLTDVAALYFTVRNEARVPDTLLAVSVMGTRDVELHRLESDAGRMRMRAVDRPVVPAGGSLRLAPGGYHVMLFGLEHRLEVGDTLGVEATFARYGSVRFPALVLTYSEIVKRLQEDNRRR